MLGVGIEAGSVLGLENIKRRKVVAGAPEEFVAEEEGMVDGAAERFPTEGGIGGINVGQKIFGIRGSADSGSIVAAGVGTAEIDIGRFAKVAVKTKMADDADILSAVGRENIRGVATGDLGGSLKEPVFRGGAEAREGVTLHCGGVPPPQEMIVGRGPGDERRREVLCGIV